MKTKNITTVLLAGLAASTSHAETAKPKKAAHIQKPNVVLIFIDDTGYGTFAPNIADFSEEDMNRDFIRNYGPDYTYAEAVDAACRAMPNLSVLCSEGIRFTNAYVTANVSSPSRAGMLTSSYQQRYGLYINQKAEKGIPENIRLMPQFLKENGYTTGIFGKYHNGQSSGENNECAHGHHPLDRGFDKFYGFNSAGTSYYGSNILFEDRRHVEADGYLTDKFTEKAVEFIKANAGTPKLVYVPYNALHGPLGVPAPEKYRQRFNYTSKILNNYAAYTAAVDDGVAAIMDAIREIGEYDNTILFFLSDNGAPGGEVQPLPKNGPFSGFKGQSWQGGYHVPMFVWYGDKIDKGTVCNQVVSSMDIFPTVFEIAGIQPPQDQIIDGKSLVPVLTGKPDTQIHEHLVWMTQQAENWAMNKVNDQKIAQAAFMVREGDFVLRYVMEDNRFYLHNLSKDRQEKEDLSAEYPEKVEHMKAIFKEWFSEMEKPNGWKPELWQNVQYWDETIPPAVKPDRSGLTKNPKRKKQD